LRSNEAGSAGRKDELKEELEVEKDAESDEKSDERKAGLPEAAVMETGAGSTIKTAIKTEKTEKTGSTGSTETKMTKSAENEIAEIERKINTILQNKKMQRWVLNVFKDDEERKEYEHVQATLANLIRLKKEKERVLKNLS
jgi:putative SOS response-associated peptidase YedK